MEIKTITLAPVDENIANYDGLKTGTINEYSFELMNTSNKKYESFKHRAGGKVPLSNILYISWLVPTLAVFTLMFYQRIVRVLLL